MGPLCAAVGCCRRGRRRWRWRFRGVRRAWCRPGDKQTENGGGNGRYARARAYVTWLLNACAGRMWKKVRSCGRARERERGWRAPTDSASASAMMTARDVLSPSESVRFNWIHTRGKRDKPLAYASSGCFFFMFFLFRAAESERRYTF